MVEIEAKITGLEYKILFKPTLKEVSFENLDVNEMPSCCFLKEKKLAVSKWVSPKRTRSYPFERIYNTLSFSKKITIIPVVKDEGKNGDRDFIQWDTISLMSLLDVYVILAYYSEAEKNPNRENKITNQKFDNDFILAKIEEIENYHSSALHWNIKEVEQLESVLSKATDSYAKIQNELGVELHSEKGLENFKQKLDSNLKNFIAFSREKAQSAQEREVQTIQPKELLGNFPKAKITITNFLGGKYFLTVDEVIILENEIILMESKHTKSNLLPSLRDIKDGLIKMILYSNFKSVSLNGKKFKVSLVLKLTSQKENFSYNSQKNDFMNFNKMQSELLLKLFKEAQTNGFVVELEGKKK
ncbi:MAG: hypothetical protein DWQ06_02570 [Calditrichaeota bacterium]|nr:MAG: hypothetical protein DWQ06_02570 [Calditrichota bacterium]